MKISRFMLALNAGLFALLCWLYLGDVMDAVRGGSAEVAALTELPNLPFAACALLATLVAGGLTVQGVMRGQPSSWRGYRLMPIVAVLVLFVDLLVLSSGRLPLNAAERAILALQIFDQRASNLATEGAVPDARALEPVLAELGPPPWLEKGAPVKRWQIEERRGCQGPVSQSEGRRPGTLFYCIDATFKQAWVTMVGLPRETRFGAPAVVTAGGQPLVVQVTVRAAEEAAAEPAQAPEPEAPPPAPADAGMQPEGIDASR